MTRLRGEGVGAGMALGTAVVVQMRDGLPVLPDPPERVARSLASRRSTERPEVILVADDLRTALALAGALPWAKVAGIAASQADRGGAVPPFPTVVGVTRLMEVVQNDLLILVDAERGVVFVDPNPIALAQYTAEHAHIAPKHRLYLDEEHQPAQTTDGATIQIVARIERWNDIEAALHQGADALHLPIGNTLLADSDEETLRRELFRLIDAAAGKPLFVSDNFALPFASLLMAAAKADLTLAIPPQESLDGLGFAELLAELREAETECYENDQVCALPRLAADLPSVSERGESAEEALAFVERLAGQSATRLLFTMTQEPLTEGTLLSLAPLLTAAQNNLLPAFVSASPFGFNAFGQNDLDNTLTTALRLLIGAGVTGILVPANQTGAAKTTVREQSAAECRDLLRQTLQEASGA